MGPSSSTRPSTSRRATRCSRSSSHRRKISVRTSSSNSRPRSRTPPPPTCRASAADERRIAAFAFTPPGASAMKIFLDTADIEEIRTAARWGILDGVTTNPSLYAKVGGSYEEILKEICGITSGPVSAEVVAEDVEGMLREGRAFAKLAPNIVVKVPISEEGLEAISRFAEEGIRTNCTLVFSSNQGLLAAKAGASLISPFVGRLDDINQYGIIVICDLAQTFA